MGYGKSSKGGGGSMTAGSSSKKMKGNKPKAMKPRKVKGEPDGESGGNGGAGSAGPAFTRIEPPSDRRAELIAAQRASRRAEHARKEELARNYKLHVTGTGTGGNVLGAGKLHDDDCDDDSSAGIGGVGCGTGAGAGASAGHAAAGRAAFLEQLEADAKAHRRGKAVAKAERAGIVVSSTPDANAKANLIPHAAGGGVGTVPGVFVPSAEREAAASAVVAAHDENGANVVANVFSFLDILAARLHECTEGNEGAAVVDSHALLCTVLRNAATKANPKYRRLKASNAKLWAGLLQHPETAAVLIAAGFVPLPADLQGDVAGGSSGAPASGPDAARQGRAQAAMERDRVQVALERELNNAAAYNPVVVESLMAKVEALTLFVSRGEPKSTGNRNGKSNDGGRGGGGGGSSSSNSVSSGDVPVATYRRPHVGLMPSAAATTAGSGLEAAATDADAPGAGAGAGAGAAAQPNVLHASMLTLERDVDFVLPEMDTSVRPDAVVTTTAVTTPTSSLPRADVVEAVTAWMARRQKDEAAVC